MKFIDYQKIVAIVCDDYGFTHSHLSRLSKVNQTTITRIYTGYIRYPRVKTGAKIIKAFNEICPDQALPTMSEKKFLALVEE